MHPSWLHGHTDAASPAASWIPERAPLIQDTALIKLSWWGARISTHAPDTIFLLWRRGGSYENESPLKKQHAATCLQQVQGLFKVTPGTTIFSCGDRQSVHGLSWGYSLSGLVLLVATHGLSMACSFWQANRTFPCILLLANGLCYDVVHLYDELATTGAFLF